MAIAAAEFRARNVGRARVCGHDVPTAVRNVGRPPELCAPCRRRSLLATRLRQAAALAREIGAVDDAASLDLAAAAHDPRRFARETPR